MPDTIRPNLMILVSLLMLATICHFSPFFNSFAYAEQSGKIIKAHEFVLTDHNEKPRGGLGMENGNPVFYLTDEEGLVRAYLTVGRDGPSFVLRDKAQNPKVIIDLDSSGVPTIGFLSDSHKPTLIISINKSNMPGISLFGKNNQLLLGIHGDNAGLGIMDSNKMPQLLMQARDGKGSLISLHDQGGDPRIALGLRDGKSFMYAFDKDGSGVFGGGQPGKGPALVLKERGKITWAAGSNGAANDARELERGIDLDALTKDWLR